MTDENQLGRWAMIRGRERSACGAGWRTNVLAGEDYGEGEGENYDSHAGRYISRVYPKGGSQRSAE